MRTDQVRTSARDVFVEPELDTGRTVARRFEQFEQHVLVPTQHIGRKPKTQHVRDVERNVPRCLVART